MRGHKIVAHIALLILSVINFASAAPLLVQEIHEVRVDVVDVAKDKATTLHKRWDTSAGWTNTPPSARSSDSDRWSEQELGPHNARSPKTDPNASPQPRLGSTDDHPLNPGPPSAQGNLNINSNASLQPRVGSTDNSQPLDPGPPSAKGSLNTDPNASPQPGLGSTADSRPLDLDPSSAHGNLNVDSNIDPPPSVGPIGNSDQVGLSSAPNINPPPTVGPTGSHPPGSGERTPTNVPFSANSPEQGPFSLNDLFGWQNDRYYSWSSATSSPGGSWETWNGMSDGRSLLHDSPASETGPTDDSRPSSPSSAHGDHVSPPSDPGSTPDHPSPAPPSDAEPSTGPHPPSPEPSQHESETFLDDLFKGKIKRRISGSYSVNVAQKELQGTF